MKRSAQHAFEPDEIMAYLDGELAPGEAASLAAHLEHCGECEALVTQLRQVSERMLDFKVEPCSDRLNEQILEASRAGFSVPQPEKRSKRRLARGLVWTFASALVLVVLAVSVPNLLHMSVTPEQIRNYQRTRRSQGGISVDNGRAPAGLPPLNGQARALNSLVTLATPGVGADSSGLYHGLGDHAENSFSVNGRPLSDQQSKIFSNQIGPMIMQTASITILASNYDQASGAIERVTAQHGGYVQDMTANTPTGSARSVSATLRVPDAQLQAFLVDLGKLGHVEQETRNNQEVTDQYVDLQARLKTARATEERILELLKTRTGNLGEVLQAEEELARIRGEIERMEGERANVEHQVRYATVQLQINEEYREQLNSQSFSTGTRIRNSLVEGFGNLASGVVSALMFAFAYGPSILFWLAILGVPAWFVWRRFRPSKAA